MAKRATRVKSEVQEIALQTQDEVALAITPSISKLPALTGITTSLKKYGFKEPTGKHTEDI